MSEALLFTGLRTPRGRASERGALRGASVFDLLDALHVALRARAGLGEGDIDDLILGCATQVKEQGADLARTSALLSGWGETVPGLTLNRFCASGLEAINVAAAKVRAGDLSLALAGGVESVSRVPMFSDEGWLYNDPAVRAAVGSVHMGVAADLVATKEGFSREALDGYARRTREKARAAWAVGDAGRSVVPVKDSHGAVLLDRDELLAYAPTADAMAALPPAFAEMGAAGQDALALSRHPSVESIAHLHTKASSPPMADGAALVLVGDAAAAERTGMRPRARVLSTATCAVDPVVMLTAGQRAAELALAKAGLTPDVVDRYEFAEAFSALCVKFMWDLGVSDERFNVMGGTMALGHAFGATGAVLMVNLLDALELCHGRYGLVAVSGAAGLGVATVIERV